MQLINITERGVQILIFFKWQKANEYIGIPELKNVRREVLTAATQLWGAEDLFTTSISI